MNPARSFSNTDCAVIAIQSLTNRSRGDIMFASGYRKGIGVTCSKIIPVLCALTGNHWMQLEPIECMEVGDLTKNFRGIIVVPIHWISFAVHAAAVEGYRIHDNIHGTKTIFDPVWRERLIQSLIVEGER